MPTIFYTVPIHRSYYFYLIALILLYRKKKIFGDTMDSDHHHHGDAPGEKSLPGGMGLPRWMKKSAER